MTYCRAVVSRFHMRAFVFFKMATKSHATSDSAKKKDNSDEIIAEITRTVLKCIAKCVK